MSRRGQAALEFLILFGFMLLVFTVFFVMIQQRSALRQEQTFLIELEAIGQAVRDEVLLASRVHDGYNRTFLLPSAVTRGPYTLTLMPGVRPSEVILDDGQTEFVVFLPLNLTTGSTIGPGRNQITKDGGSITLRAVALPGQPCGDDDDCPADHVCVVAQCVACVDADDDGYPLVGSPAACGSTSDCDDGNDDIHPGAPELCSDLVDNDCDLLVDGVDGDCLTCSPPTDNTLWVAGGTSLVDSTAGTVWTQRLDGGNANACCDRNTQCSVNASIAGSCVAHGWVAFPGATSRAWVCGNMTLYGGTPTGPNLFRCTAANDGRLIGNATAGYCCSIFTSGGNVGTYGFNAGLAGNANKAEALSTGVNSCSDGSDNDCDGKPDGYDDLCWNALISSTCGSDTSGENITAYPNSTMQGAGDYVTRFAYDWRVGGSSLAAHQYTFDYADDAGGGMTQDHSSLSANMTSVPGKFLDPAWTLRDGSHYGLLVFDGGSGDGSDDWTNVTTAPPAGAYSIELWVRPDEASADRNIIVLTAADPLTAYSHQVRLVRVPGGFIDQNRFVHYLWDGTARTVSSTATYVPGGWHHVVATATPSGMMRLYVDGIETGTAASIGTPWAGGTRWMLGTATGGGFSAYRGAIDEVRIYHRALSANQVASLYARGYDRIVSQEIAVGEKWEARVTPTNGTHHGVTVISNELEILAGSPVCGSCACVKPDSSCATPGDPYPGNACMACSSGGWVPVADGTSCANGVACDGAETCVAGSCAAGFPPACLDPAPYCVEPDGACAQCISDSDCDSRCVAEVTKTGVDVVFYPSSSCKSDACEASAPEICSSGASEPSDIALYCHGAHDDLPVGCCGQLGFACPEGGGK